MTNIEKYLFDLNGYLVLWQIETAKEIAAAMPASATEKTQQHESSLVGESERLSGTSQGSWA